MLPNEIFVTFKESLIGIFLLNVHKVHVLNPTLSLNHQCKPDGSEDMHNNHELESHHENFEVDFGALR